MPIPLKKKGVPASEEEMPTKEKLPDKRRRQGAPGGKGPANRSQPANKKGGTGSQDLVGNRPAGRGTSQGRQQGRPAGGRGNQRGGRGTHQQSRGPRPAPVPVRPRGPVELTSVMTVRELSEALGISAAEIIKLLLKNGIMANINQQIDYDTAAVIASDLGVETTEQVPEQMSGLIEDISEALAIEKPEDLRVRPPMVTIMGHVDHGKTKLLDAIRQTRVAEGEAGGITQHIGAYQIEVQGRKIAFLDTPGHEAFTAMRARGAKVTDVVVLVVAADDGVKPQTEEAIAHVTAAGVPMIVAVNKIDVPGANPDRVRQQLAASGITVEHWGGDVPDVEVSAKQRLNIDGLLEMVLLVADLQDLKANPNGIAVGTIVEAELDKSRGPVATVLVQNGTLRQDDNVVVGSVFGKIRAMFSDTGRRIRSAEPSTPVEILGLNGVPQAGDILQVVDSLQVAREVATQRQRQRQMEAMAAQLKTVTLDDLFSRIQQGQVKELNIILKADVQGSIGAIDHALNQLNEKQTDVQVRAIHKGTGTITESDVNLAVASNGIIIGFNARPDAAARRVSEQHGVDIRYYNVIYHLLEDLQKAMVGMLEPEQREVTTGFAEVRDTFRLPGKETVAGLYITDGKISRNDLVRVLRSGVVVHDGRITSLKRFKDDVRDVQSGYECGLMVDGFNDIEVGDTMEFYRREKVERTV